MTVPPSSPDPSPARGDGSFVSRIRDFHIKGSAGAPNEAHAHAPYRASTGMTPSHTGVPVPLT